MQLLTVIVVHSWSDRPILFRVPNMEHNRFRGEGNANSHRRSKSQIHQRCGDTHYIFSSLACYSVLWLGDCRWRNNLQSEVLYQLDAGQQ